MKLSELEVCGGEVHLTLNEEEQREMLQLLLHPCYPERAVHVMFLLWLISTFLIVFIMNGGI